MRHIRISLVALLAAALLVLSATGALAATKSVGVAKSGTKYKFTPPRSRSRGATRSSGRRAGACPTTSRAPASRRRPPRRSPSRGVHEGGHLPRRLHAAPSARPADDDRRPVDGDPAGPASRRPAHPAGPPRVRGAPPPVGRGGAGGGRRGG